jgi:hypothetical protein
VTSHIVAYRIFSPAVHSRAKCLDYDVSDKSYMGCTARQASVPGVLIRPVLLKLPHLLLRQTLELFIQLYFFRLVDVLHKANFYLYLLKSHRDMALQRFYPNPGVKPASLSV